MTTELNYRSTCGQFQNIQKFNNIFLNNQWVKNEIKKQKQIIKYFELNSNKSIVYENLRMQSK